MRLVKYFFVLVICNYGYPQQGLFEELQASPEPELVKVFDSIDKYEVQILYTSVERTEDGSVRFNDISYKVDDSVYFYPASTVKLPLAVLALEKLNEMRSKGISIQKESEYHFVNDTVKYTIADDINSIFAISDNDAYNRLFEFLGQDYINKKIKEKGLGPVRISHRFSGETSLDTVTRQLIFQVAPDEFYRLPVTHNKKAEELEIKHIEKGKAYIKDDSLINGAFSFRLKNYFPLKTQQQLMKQLFFPELYPAAKRFNLEENDWEFLKNAMSAYPRQLNFNSEEYFDSYGKFFLFGDSMDSITSNIKIYNKVGYAYGTLTETAYIVDPDHGVEFFLSATILVNDNQVFNDDKYEFDNIGVPFLAELGRQIYNYELKRRSN